MKTHEDAYQPFLLDQTVDQHCDTHIQPFLVEIDHVGMNALIDALIKPAAFTVEILYLDRSEGDEGNTIRFEATNLTTGGPLYPDAPCLRLLYRP